MTMGAMIEVTELHVEAARGASRDMRRPGRPSAPRPLEGRHLIA